MFGLYHEDNVQTRAHSYDTLPIVLDPSGSHPNGSLAIDKPTIDIVPRPHKGVLRKTNDNPNARECQHYSIVEELDQEHCAMSALEVLQSCPTQRK